MSAAGWGAAAKQRLQHEWAECKLTRVAVNSLRKQAIMEVGEGSDADHHRLSGANWAGQRRSDTRIKVDALSRCLCRHRESVGQVVVSAVDADGVVAHFLFVVGSKNPLKACYLPLTPLEPGCVAEECSEHLPRFMTFWSYAWQLHLGPVSGCLPPGLDADLTMMEVFSNVCFIFDDLIVSDVGPMFADDYIMALEGADAKMNAESSEDSSDSDSDLHDTPVTAPWVMDFLHRQTVRHSVSSHIAESRRQEAEDHPTKRKKTGDPVRSDRLPLPESLPDDVLSCWAELQQERDVWKDRQLAEVRDFKMVILGGAWTKMSLGRDYDAVRIAASHASASRWCRLYGLQLSARYDLELYGRELAGLLAHAWGLRMQFYYDLFCNSDDDPFVYDDSVHATYVESAEVVEAVQAVGGQASARLEQIRAIRPSAPVC